MKNRARQPTHGYITTTDLKFDNAMTVNRHVDQLSWWNLEARAMTNVRLLLTE